jgi:cob(I)alamin adenosyltransferase
MSIVTKTGDDGMTGLYGAPRISKTAPRIAAYGDIDELNAVFGMILAEPGIADRLRADCQEIQQILFRVGADLATPLTSEATPPRMERSHVEQIEEWIKEHEAVLPPQTSFILPGGTRAAGLLHFARTVCRRAERAIVLLAQTDDLTPHVRIYVNRLSDWCFIAARAANAAAGVKEEEVRYG